MDIYHYHPETREYLGVGQADPDPLVHGNFLIPAYAVKEPPPPFGPRQVAVYRDGWQVVADYRGVRYWLGDGSEHVIERIGEVPPPDALDAPPPPPPPEPEPEPPSPLEQAKERKRDDLKFSYVVAFCGGFESSALGTAHRYESESDALVKLIGAVVAGENVDYECVDLATGEAVIRTHTPAQIQQVLRDGKRLAEQYKRKLHSLLKQVEAAATIEEVNAIVW